MSKNILLASAILLTGVLFTPTFAVWNPPLASPPGRNIPPALNIGATSQEKTGGLKLDDLVVNQGGQFSKIEVGGISTGLGGLSAGGDIRASRFCLGSTPSPEGCISSWQGSLNLSGGRANSLVRWLSNSEVSNSSISEVDDNIVTGTALSPRGVTVNGGLNIESGTRLSGLKISQFAGVLTQEQIASLPKSSKILSIDATGKVILTNADCVGTATPPPVVITPSSSIIVEPPPPAMPLSPSVSLGRGFFAVAMSADGVKQTVVGTSYIGNGAFSGHIYTSSDSGVTWTPRTVVTTTLSRSRSVAVVGQGVVPAPDSSKFVDVAMSADGVKQIIADSDSGYIYTSSDSGVTWTSRDVNPIVGSLSGPHSFQSVAMSADGVKQTVIDSYNNRAFTSSDSGLTWISKTIATGTHTMRAVAMSAFGETQTAVFSSGHIYNMSYPAMTWTGKKITLNTIPWNDVAMSYFGQIQAATSDFGYIYASSDYGVTWTQRRDSEPRKWRSIAMSADGTKQTAVGYLDRFYTSSDSGVTWTPRTVPAGRHNWMSIAMSAGGATQTAISTSGYIYVSYDSGVTWIERVRP